MQVLQANLVLLHSQFGSQLSCCLVPLWIFFQIGQSDTLAQPPKNQVIKTAWASFQRLFVGRYGLNAIEEFSESTNQNHKVLEIKIKCQIKECLTDIKDDSNLSQQDIAWGSFLDLQFQPAVRNALLLKTGK
jgi:hypothetical protein